MDYLLDQARVRARKNEQILRTFPDSWENNEVLRKKSWLAGNNKSLRGSSFVATSAPERFGGMRRPRPLMHGTAQAIVSARTFSRLKTEASRAGNVTGSFTGMLRSGGPFNFLKTSQIFAFIARKILGAKYKNAAIPSKRISKASSGLK